MKVMMVGGDIDCGRCWLSAEVIDVCIQVLAIFVDVANKGGGRGGGDRGMQSVSDSKREEDGKMLLV